VLEKPYIIYENGRYYLMRPKAEWNKRSYTPNWNNSDRIDFSNVYVANSSDSAATINAKLQQVDNLVLQPGIYFLEDSIKVTKNNTIILGMGLATLHPTNGTPAIEVGNYTGVRVAGVLLEAGEKTSQTLL